MRQNLFKRIFSRYSGKQELIERVETLKEDREILIDLFNRMGFDAKLYIADQREEMDSFHTSPAIGHGLKLRIEFGPDQPFSEQGLEWATSYLEHYFFRHQKPSIPVTG
jgi:hypothetical protein